MRRQVYPSVVIGVVTNNKDPDGLGRVKVRFPWLDTSDESHWARVAQFMTGGGRGMWIIPEIDDEVLVAFEHGDIHFPYVLGSLWNGVDRPPATSGMNSDGKNNIRMFQSRAGHQIVFDDTPGGEKIHLHDGSTKNSVDLYNFQNSVHFTAATGDIIIAAPEGTITIETTTLETKSTEKTSYTVGKGYRVGVTGSTTLTAGAKTSIHTKTTAALDIGASASLTAGSLLKMQSTKIDMKGDGSVKFKSGIVNLVTGITYGLDATKMSLDTGMLGYLRGVQFLKVQGGILAAIRGLLLTLTTLNWKGTAAIAVSDIAGGVADIRGSKHVMLNKKEAIAAAGTGKPPVKLWPPRVSSLKDFTQWAEENWKRLPEWAREPVGSLLKDKMNDLVAKIPNPLLRAAVGGALGAAGSGDWGAIGKGVLEAGFDEAKKAGAAELNEWINKNVPEGPLRDALTKAVQQGNGQIPADLFGDKGLFPTPPPPSGAGNAGGAPPDTTPQGGGV